MDELFLYTGQSWMDPVIPESKDSGICLLTVAWVLVITIQPGFLFALHEIESFLSHASGYKCKSPSPGSEPSAISTVLLMKASFARLMSVFTVNIRSAAAKVTFLANMSVRST